MIARKTGDRAGDKALAAQRHDRNIEVHHLADLCRPRAARADRAPRLHFAAIRFHRDNLIAREFDPGHNRFRFNLDAEPRCRLCESHRDRVRVGDAVLGAKRRADKLFNELWGNDDDANHAAAQRVLAGRYTWLEEGIADPSGDGAMIPPEVKPAAAREDTSSSRDGTRASNEHPEDAPAAGKEHQSWRVT